jgi:hypothetical protein
MPLISNTYTVSIHIHVNNVEVHMDTLSRKQESEFKRAFLSYFKPLNKNQYLELDLDSNNEYAVLKCTNQHDIPCELPKEITSRLNQYVYIPVVSEWKPTDRITIVMSFL